MIRNTRGISLIEVVIASLILTFLGVAVMGSMRAGFGFTIMAGRQAEGLAHGKAWTESLRNEVHPIDPDTGQHPLDDPVWDASGTEPMTNIAGDVERTVIENPFGAPAGSVLAEMKGYQLDVQWTEAR